METEQIISNSALFFICIWTFDIIEKKSIFAADNWLAEQSIKTGRDGLNSYINLISLIKKF